MTGVACSERYRPTQAAFLSFKASFSSLSWFSVSQLFWFTLTVLRQLFSVKKTLKSHVTLPVQQRKTDRTWWGI